jgi:hypothetical protein
MRFKTLIAFTAFALISCASARAQAQQQQQEQQQVIDDFTATRGVSFDEGPSQKKTQPQKQAAPHRNNPIVAKSHGANPSTGSTASAKTSTGKTSASNKTGKRDGAESGDGAEVAAQGDDAGANDAGARIIPAGTRSLALGYTILLKDAATDLFRVVDRSREFKTEERIRISLETNADGYLYMFTASDGERPEMQYPSVRVESGGNALKAHTLETFPTRVATDADSDKYDLEFTDPPATEHLFIVFSRRPLADVPTDEALVRFCGKRKDCAWTPTAAQWARIKESGNDRVIEAKNTQLAQAGASPVMPGTLQRGLKIKLDDPKPAVVRVNNSPGANVIFTEIVFTHK